MTEFNFEQAEEEINTSEGIHLRQIDMTEVPIFVNASVHAGEAFVTVSPGTYCDLEECNVDHGGERMKYNIVFFDMYETEDCNEQAQRFMVPLDSPLGQAMVNGDFCRAVLHKMEEFAEQVGEPIEWVENPE